MNIESFCKTVWGLSYDEVQAKATKKEYSEFFIPKKSGKGLSQKLIIKRMAQPFAMKFCYLGKM